MNRRLCFGPPKQTLAQRSDWASKTGMEWLVVEPSRTLLPTSPTGDPGDHRFLGHGRFAAPDDRFRARPFRAGVVGL